ncbi:MAG: uracil phosphoribosyltransferase [Pseudomonadota bacterium]
MTDAPTTTTLVDHPLVRHKLSLMRDVDCSTAKFRRLLREISQFLAYEALRDLPIETRRIQTPLEEMEAPFIAGKKLVFVSILRAGNGLLDGLLELVPAARVGFVGLYRDPETLEPVEYYKKLPSNLEERPVVLVDPMLATANSAIAAIDNVKAAGAKDVRFICLLAAPEGAAKIAARHPDVRVYAAAMDERLTDHGYIAPGLGDAGDRMFGTK